MGNPLSWLKAIGKGIAAAAVDVAHFLASPQVQKVEAQAANLAQILLPQDAPIIQTFQGIVGRIFQQAIVTETQFQNISNAGPQKLAAVVGAFGPELDQWAANHFPGAQQVSDAIKAGLVSAIVDLQNALPAPPAAPPA